MGTTLLGLGLGLACLVGGVSREEQVFSQERAGHLSSLLLIVVAALLLPAVFDHADLARAATVPERRMSEQALGVIQVGLVIAPLLVLLSFAMGQPMTLVFHSLLNLFAITGAAFIVNAVAADGKTTWFEGLLLVGVYLLLVKAFFFVKV